jgi:hypothetical protein
LGDPSDLFQGSESFFVDLVTLAQSAVFERMVEGFLAAFLEDHVERWLAVAAPDPSASAAGEGERGGRLRHRLDDEATVDGLAALKLLGRFLGFLVCRPYWPLALAVSRAQRSSDPLEALVEVAAQAADASTMPLFEHAPGWLASAHAKGCLLLVVPWLCDLLAGLRWDLVQRRSAACRRLLGALLTVRAQVDPTRSSPSPKPYPSP